MDAVLSPEATPEVPPVADPVPPVKKKGGNPALVKGCPSLNPDGKAGKRVPIAEFNAMKKERDALLAEKRLREEQEADRDPEGGAVSSTRMRKVLSQEPSQDVGPTERRLREWLVKDVKGYLVKIEELEEAEAGRERLRADLAIAKERLATAEEKLREKEAERADGVDGGEERAKVLVDRLLAEVHE